MGTDRELLELAARAAGLEYVKPMPDYSGSLGLEIGGNPMRTQTWNPLTDDGDALRLAMKLRINIEHMRDMGGKHCGINCWPVGRGDCGVSEDSDLIDYEAATRRAIVRAATAIGKDMK